MAEPKEPYREPDTPATDPDQVLDKAGLTHDSELPLDTGMKVKDAVAQAMAWWTLTGAPSMRMARKSQKGKRNQDVGPFSMDPDSPNALPSRILHGREWDELTREDRVRVVKVWHHFHVRVPMGLSSPKFNPVLDPDRCYYCGAKAVADEELPDASPSRPICEEHFRYLYPDEAKASLELHKVLGYSA